MATDRQIPPEFAGFFAPWRLEAACRDSPTARFFPTADSEDRSAGAAKKVCADCPVKVDCIVHAVGLPEYAGIWGGISSDNLRRFRGAWLARPHAEAGPVDNCLCAWCEFLVTHLKSLAGDSSVRRPTPKGNRTHGIRVTYGRGCRCAPCTFSARQWGQYVRRIGVQPYDVFEETPGLTVEQNLLFSSVEARRLVVDALTTMFNALGCPVDRSTVDAGIPPVTGRGNPATVPVSRDAAARLAGVAA